MERNLGERRAHWRKDRRMRPKGQRAKKSSVDETVVELESI